MSGLVSPFCPMALTIPREGCVSVGLRDLAFDGKCRVFEDGHSQRAFYPVHAQELLLVLLAAKSSRLDAERCDECAARPYRTPSCSQQMMATADAFIAIEDLQSLTRLVASEEAAGMQVQ